MVDHIAQVRFTFLRDLNLSQTLNESQMYTPNFSPVSSADDGTRQMLSQYQEWSNCIQATEYWERDSCTALTLIPSGGKIC